MKQCAFWVEQVTLYSVRMIIFWVCFLIAHCSLQSFCKCRAKFLYLHDDSHFKYVTGYKYGRQFRAPVDSFLFFIK